MRVASLALSRFVRQHPLAIIAVTLVASLVLALGIPRLEFETGQDRLLAPDSQIARDNERFQAQFGGDPVLVLFETPAGGDDIRHLFTAENRRQLAALEQELSASGRVHRVISPLTVLEFALAQVERQMAEAPARLAREQQQAADTARAEAAAAGATPEEQEAAAQAAAAAVAAAFAEEIGADAERFAAAGEPSLDNPAFIEFLMFEADGRLRPAMTGIFPDERHALMVVRLDGNLSIDAASEGGAVAVETIEGYEFDGVNVLASGPPLLIKEINDTMRDAFVTMAVFAVVIMLVVLFLVFRARWRLLSLPAVLIGCVAAFGLMGFLGLPLTLVTISGLPILIGLGVDFAIQAHSRIEDETFASDSAEAGLDEAFARLGPPLTMALIASCIGFLVLFISDVPMVRDFATMLAVGSVIVFVAPIALISGVIYMRERTRLGERPEVHVRFEVERWVGGLTARTVGRFAPIAAVALLLAAGGLYFGQRIETQTDPERFVPDDSAVLRDLHAVRDVTGSTSEVNLLVEAGDGGTLIDDGVLAWMLAYERRLVEEQPLLPRSNSLASLVAALTGGPPTADAAHEFIDTAPEALVRSVISEDGRSASMTFPVSGDERLSERQRVTEMIVAGANPPAGISVAPAGIAVIGTATVEALSSNRELMSFVALAVILLVLLAYFRNPMKAVAPLLPVVVALGASAMLLYLMGVEYSPLTSISGPLIIALATEYNILLMARYFEERARGFSPREAMATASRRIGRAITASGLTVMGGFAVLALSNFPLLDNFGRVTALNIGLSLLCTLVLLPPLLVWADEESRFLGAPTEPVEPVTE
jgi:uncharacterized protein